MNPPVPTIVVGVALFASMAAYALFAGADFGGGIWDLLAGGSERGRRAREAIDASVTPVWEGNQTWIVLGLVLLWTGFPDAFAAVTVALFIPLALSVLGLVLRGVGFAFRHEVAHPGSKRLTGVLFAASSVLAPFFLGTAVGAVTTGEVTPNPPGNVVSAWTSPVALITGALFVATCAYIGGVYLVGDCHRRGAEDLAHYFGRRTAGAGVVTGVLAGVNLWLLHGEAPYVFGRLTGIALPLVIVSVVAGAVTFGLIVLRRQWLLRITAGLAVSAVVAAWGLAQYPYLLPTTLPLGAGSSPSSTIYTEIAVIGMAVLFVVPAFVYLYWLQQHGRLEHDSASLRLTLSAHRQQGGAGPDRTRTDPPPRRHPLLATVVVGAAVVDRLRRSRR